MNLEASVERLYRLSEPVNEQVLAKHQYKLQRTYDLHGATYALYQSKDYYLITRTRRGEPETITTRDAL